MGSPESFVERHPFLVSGGLLLGIAWAAIYGPDMPDRLKNRVFFNNNNTEQTTDDSSNTATTSISPNTTIVEPEITPSVTPEPETTTSIVSGTTIKPEAPCSLVEPTALDFTDTELSAAGLLDNDTVQAAIVDCPGARFSLTGNKVEVSGMEAYDECVVVRPDFDITEVSTGRFIVGCLAQVG